MYQMGLAIVGWIGLAVLMLVLSLLFKVAGKLRLTIPLVYLLIVSFGGGIFFPEWVDENEPMLLLGLYIRYIRHVQFRQACRVDVTGNLTLRIDLSMTN